MQYTSKTTSLHFKALNRPLDFDCSQLGQFSSKEEMFSFYESRSPEFLLTSNEHVRYLYEIRYLGKVSVKEVPPEPVKPIKKVVIE